MSRFKQNFYSIEKFVYKDKRWQYIRNNDFLFADGIYPTKIKAGDLPEHYVYGRYYKCWGYMSAKGVVDLIYVPNLYVNHFLKDDCLYISYSQKMTYSPEKDWYERCSGCDESIYGREIIDFLIAANKYSGLNIDKIKKQIKEKAEWLVKTYPDEFGKWVYDEEKWFDANK